MEILQDNKEKFGTDFVENKKILEEISVVRSKELKNELAGFITKFIKREIRDNEEKLAKEAEVVKRASTAEEVESTDSKKPNESDSQNETESSSN